MRKDRDRKDFPSELYLSVLGYIEEGQYIAHCLEMDLIGVGDSPKEALEDLDCNIDMQVCFALYKNNPDLLWHPAEDELFEIFYSLFQRQIRNFNRQIRDDYEITQIPYPSIDSVSEFQPVYA